MAQWLLYEGMYTNLPGFLIHSFNFFGYLIGAEDYNIHVSAYRFSSQPYEECPLGYDLWRNETVSRDEIRKYSTIFFAEEAQKIVKEHDKKSPLFLYLAFQAVHMPLQVSDKYLKQYQHIKDKKRRIYSSVVSAMDEAIGIRNVTRTLKESDLWSNTILIFSTDNGGAVHWGGNNWPLRGYKGGLFEGGMRGVGFVNSPLLQNPARLSHEMLHVSDWFPTLVSLAGGDLNGTRPLDGYDIWETINTGTASPRTEILHNIDPVETPWFPGRKYKWCPQAALRVGNWKLLACCPGDPNWYPPPSSDLEVEDIPDFEYEKIEKVYGFLTLETIQKNAMSCLPSILTKLESYWRGFKMTTAQQCKCNILRLILQLILHCMMGCEHLGRIKPYNIK